MIDLEAHKKAEEEATPGPWNVHPNGSTIWSGSEYNPEDRDQTLLIEVYGTFGPTTERIIRAVSDTELVTLMRNDHAEMIREIERLREARAIERARMSDANARIRELRAKLFEERANMHNDRANVSEITATLLLSLASTCGVLADDIRTMIAAEVRGLRARNRFRSIAAKIRRGEM